MRVAGFIGNLVPYHDARWSAFADLGTAECALIELTHRDEFPILEVAASTKRSYQRITLFEDKDSSRLKIREVVASAQRTLTELRPHVVCVNGYASPSSLAALQWCSSGQVPVVICSESNVFDEPRKRWREALKRRLLRFCAAGLAGGTPQADYLARLGLPTARIFKGYDVVDNEFFARGAERARQDALSVRRKFGLPEHYFLASARFREKKNLPRLLRAYALYRERAETRKQKAEIWDLVLLGDGPQREQLAILRSELGLTERVHFAGPRPYAELPEFYGLAGAFVHASTTEQWGLVVNEAMACSLPVLLSNRCGCAADLLREDQNGFTFDPRDIESLAEQMLKITADGFPLTGFGSVSREIIGRWTPKAFAENLLQAVKAALEVPPPRATVFDRALFWGLLRA